jgi:uncharacterized protein YndB with AHSA1/START domain
MTLLIVQLIRYKENLMVRCFPAARFALCAALLACFLSPILARSQSSEQSHVTVTRTAAPEKRLDFEVTVPATIAQVWEALSTSKGLSTWLFPNAVVDLRPGGDWIVKFPGGSTGGGTIVAFVPQQRLEIAALAPDQFPTVRRERTHATFELRAADDGKSTVVHLAQTGWKSGEEWDKAYDYLAGGNAELLESLRQRFVSGPVDWDAMFKQSK